MIDPAKRISADRRKPVLYHGVTVMHVKDGGPVLRGEASCRTVSGVLLCSRRLRFRILIQFRKVAL